MIYGIGVDIVNIARIQKSLERFGDRFVEKILTENEQVEYHANPHPSRFLAKRFAAKEAIFKAFGLGMRNGLSWQHLEIARTALGKPEIKYDKQADKFITQQAITASHLSISDESQHAIAYVVLEVSLDVK